MELNFRQGIVRYQTDISGTPAALIKNDDDPRYIDLVISPDPTVLTFAYGTENYTVEENRTITRAWGPFNFPVNYYLYWDVDLVTGELSRGQTQFPVLVQVDEPTVKREDQHWYNTDDMKMYVYDSNNARWLPKLRVFAGTFNSSAILEHEPLGSQVGVDETINSGYILYDINNEPIRTREGYFVTTEHRLQTNIHQQLSGSNSTAFTVETRAKIVTSENTIPRHSLVTLISPTEVKLTNPFDGEFISGMVSEEIYPGENGRMIFDEVVYNVYFEWPPESINKPLFCDSTGRLTLTPPISADVIQQVGWVLGPDHIRLCISEPILLK